MITFDGLLEKARPLLAMTDPAIDLDSIAEAVEALPTLASIDQLTDHLVSPQYDAVGDAATAGV